MPKLLKNRSATFFSKTRILSSYIKDNGYVKVCLTKDKKQKEYFLHRLACIHFVPNDLNKPDVNHKNGIKSDNTFKNLEWCTKKENSTHASKMGLLKVHRGEDNACSKITEKQVLEIRDIFKSNPKINKSEIARDFNIGRTTLLHILSRNTWKHI